MTANARITSCLVSFTLSVLLASCSVIDLPNEAVKRVIAGPGNTDGGNVPSRNSQAEANVAEASQSSLEGGSAPAAPAVQATAPPTQAAPQQAERPLATVSAASCVVDNSKLIPIIAVAAALQNRRLPQPQYGKNDELRAEKLVAETKQNVRGRSFQFILPVSREQVVVEQETLMIKPINFSGLLPTTPSNGNSIVVDRFVKTVGQTTDQGPFAGSRPRQIAQDEEFILALNVQGGDYARWPKGFKQMTLRIDQEKGQRAGRKRLAAPELGVLFAAHLLPPYMFQSVIRQKPRPDFPRDVSTLITSVLLEVECAALIDRSKNITLASIPIGP